MYSMAEMYMNHILNIDALFYRFIAMWFEIFSKHRENSFKCYLNANIGLHKTKKIYKTWC